MLPEAFQCYGEQYKNLWKNILKRKLQLVVKKLIHSSNSNFTLCSQRKDMEDRLLIQIITFGPLEFNLKLMSLTQPNLLTKNIMRNFGKIILASKGAHTFNKREMNMNTNNKIILNKIIIKTNRKQLTRRAARRKLELIHSQLIITI